MDLRKFFLGRAIGFLIVIVLVIIYFTFFDKRPSNTDSDEQVFCTMEAKECPDGSYVGRIPPNCEFAACPSEIIPADWLTFNDQVNNVTFRYPKTLGKKYISEQEWPPKLSISRAAYDCQAGDASSSLPNQTIERQINQRTYCISMTNDAAAGTVYGSYTYTTVWQDKLLAMTFVLRYPQCLNYEEPNQTECVDERQNFDIDGLMDQIVSSVAILSDDSLSAPMSEAEAKAIAEKTCIKGGESLLAGIYNAGTKTWWFDANLNTTKEGCNPACVVSEETKTAEINWRCTGLIMPNEIN